MNMLLGIIIGLIILMLLVVAHEFGHFIMARRNGVKVNEFGIGFPPRLAAWRRNPEWHKGDRTQKKWLRLPKSEWNKPQDTLVFSINLLPIGGFCSMDGESAADRRPGTLGAASFWSKTKILFGGVMMNWLVAAVLLTILAFVGMPQFIPHQFYLGNDAKIISGGVTVYDIMADSPAAKAGLRNGDQILAVGDTTVLTPTEVTNYGNTHAGETIDYKILRNSEELTLPVQLNPAGSDYLLGVYMSPSQTLIKSTWSAPIVGVGTTLQLTGETFRGLGDLVWNLFSGIVSFFSPDTTVRQAGQAAIQTAGDSVSGPIGILGTIFPAFVSSGVINLLFLTALISVSLACMNVLPIPALDGGRWLLIAIYKLLKKPLTKETEERVVSRAFMVLFALIIIISVLDIIRLF